METRADDVQEERAGLVALGLIMQLVGSIVAAYLVVRSLEEVLPYHLGLGPTRYFGDFYDFYDQENYDRAGLVSRAWHLPLLASLGIVRALLHRRAGGAILYRHRGRAGALHAYLAAALIHTGLCVAVFLQDRTSPTYQWSIAALLGAAWPMCLVVAATRPRFRRALRRGPAAMEDTAPDQLATLTIFLGLVGAMVALFVAYAGSERYWGDSPMGSNALVVIGVLLLVRAVVQLRSGLRVAGRATGASEPWPRCDTSRSLWSRRPSSASDWWSISAASCGSILCGWTEVTGSRSNSPRPSPRTFWPHTWSSSGPCCFSGLSRRARPRRRRSPTEAGLVRASRRSAGSSSPPAPSRPPSGSWG